MDERAYWLGFSQVPNIGPTRFAKLLKHFGSAQVAWESSEKEVANVIGHKLAAAFIDFKKKFHIEEYEEKMQKAKVGYVIVTDATYPELLKQIKNPPFVLFYKGNKKVLEQEFAIGIVGTRKITSYGRQVTEIITRELVDAGCIIVSGLAMGVDAVAHQTTIDNGGKTIAVLGCGVDCCYPRENERLYTQILEHDGVVISEYGVGMAPTVGSFPSRNRIIAGLSQGIVVTEGAADSGALITARDALAASRKVFAVPGPVTSSLSQGPYQLIKSGAVVVGSGKEILEELQIKSSTGTKSTTGTTRMKGKTKEEQRILGLLADQELHFDDLVKLTKIDSSQLGTILSLMEMKGMIKSLDAGFFGIK